MFRAGILFTFAITSFAQSERPDFTGTWRLIGGTRTENASATQRIEQSGTTFAITPILENHAVDPIVYPTDGSEQSQLAGRRKITRTGHWEGQKLVLESRSRFRGAERTTRQVISLSGDGTVMTTTFHTLGGDGRHDQETVFQRISK